MQYDPVKRTLGEIVNRKPWMRKLFYRLLDIHLLRTWHVRKYLGKWAATAPGGARILDAGSGFGQYTYSMARLRGKYLIDAVDVKEEQIRDCRAFFDKAGFRDRVSFREADLTRFVKPGQYDLILSVDVMEHIEDDRQVFRNFRESLVPGGMLLVSTPSDRGGSDVHDGEEESFIDEHVRDGYGPEEIMEKLRKAGFSRVETRFSYGRPGKLSWKLGMKYPISLLNHHRWWFAALPFYFLLTYPLIMILNYLDTHINHSTGTGLIVRAWK